MALNVHLGSGFFVWLQGDTELRVSVRFVNMQPDGSVNTYPLMLRCSLVGLWSLREIVSEENYMAVRLSSKTQTKMYFLF